MTQKCTKYLFIFTISCLLCFTEIIFAADSLQSIRSTRSAHPIIIPAPPNVNAKSYVLMDANSGKILAEKNMSAKNPPASLTKIMTVYLISQALKNGSIHLDDKVRISKKAWRMNGSKMFVRAGNNVPVKDLIQGIVVASGNDSCIAMSEFIAGSEESFASMMNSQAKALGLENTNFTDSTGMPNPKHYTTAYDLALLAQTLIRDFPQNYTWFKQKWFIYNNIKQPNRNRLLWRYPETDGIKTGHTDEAGYCLVASAQKQGMRLISVILGAPSDETRTEDSIRLLNYGFRFFDTHMLAYANSTLENLRVWGGKRKTIPIGVQDNLYITLSRGQSPNFKFTLQAAKSLKMPIKKGQIVGQINIVANGQQIATYPLIALEDDLKGGVWRRGIDYISRFFHSWFSKTDKPLEMKNILSLKSSSDKT